MSTFRDSGHTRDCPVHQKEMPCHVCKFINDSARGRGRRMRLQEENNLRPQGYIVTGHSTPEDAAAFAKRVGNDPIRAAALAADARRPYGASKERHSIALRQAAREPMLSANPESLRLGLDANRAVEYIRKHRPMLSQNVSTIIVKPDCLMTAKYGRNSAYWGDRLWNIWSLKYAKGFLAVTDIRDYTRSFFTVGELIAAVKASGWKIVR